MLVCVYIYTYVCVYTYMSSCKFTCEISRYVHIQNTNIYRNTVQDTAV